MMFDRYRRYHAASLALAGLASAALLLPACSGARGARGQNSQEQQPTPEPDGANPTVSIEPGYERHVIVVTAPTGGWSLRWEKRVVRDETVEEYLTIRRPNPEIYHVQAVTPHRINSNAPLSGPIKVFIRVVDHGQNTQDVPFELSATEG